MEFLRTWWPTVLGIAVVLYYLTTVLRHRGATFSRLELFRRRNEDGLFTLFVFAILIALVFGAQLTQWRSVQALRAIRTDGSNEIAGLRKNSQVWSLKHRVALASLDSLRLAQELADELQGQRPISGVIRHGGTGDVIDGATITLARHDHTLHSKVRIVADRVKCDEEGRFQVLAPALGPNGRLRAVVTADGFRAEEFWLDKGAFTEPLSVELSPL